MDNNVLVRVMNIIKKFFRTFEWKIVLMYSLLIMSGVLGICLIMFIICVFGEAIK